MCVLIVKNKGAEMPSFETLKQCYYANPDGCGFSSGEITFKTTDFATFYNVLTMYVNKDDACIIHFRFATHGSVKDSNCHPFKDEETGVVFAHNGILPIESKNDKTDSEIFFRSKALPMIKKFGLNSSKFSKFIEKWIGGSKFAFITKEGQINRFGDFTEFDGVFYSNMRWRFSYRYCL